MNTLSLVIQREYLTRVRKKSFIILTLLMPLLMVALSFVPLWLSTLNDGGEKNIVVIDNTEIYAPLLESTDTYKFQIVGKAHVFTRLPKLLGGAHMVEIWAALHQYFARHAHAVSGLVAGQQREHIAAGLSGCGQF